MKRNFIILILFYISTNALTQGFLPSNEIKKLEKIEYSELPIEVNKDSIFCLYITSQTKMFPKNLSEFKNLHKVFIFKDDVANLDEELYQLTKLNHLVHLEIHASFFKKFPNAICEMRSLRYLKMSGQEFTSISPKIDNLQNLEHLFLGSFLSGTCKIKKLPIEILNLDKLVSLGLWGNNDLIFDETFYQLTFLKQLSINQIDKSKFNFQRICKTFKALETLAIHSTGISNLTGISSLNKLSSLSLHEKHLKNTRQIQELNNLKQVTVGYTSRNKKMIRHLSKTPNLEYIGFSFTSRCNKRITFPKKGFKNIKYVSILNQCKTSQENIENLFSKYSSIKKIYYTENVSIEY